MMESRLPNGVRAEINSLECLSRQALLARWREVHRTEPPKHLSRDLLLRSLTYALQEQSVGGLTKAERKALRSLANDGGNQRPRAAIRAGTRLYREWQGVSHEVLITDTGCRWRGKDYQSLSEVARAITGTRWSGPRFFGLRP